MKIFKIFLVVILAGALLYVFRVPIFIFSARVQSQILPCRQPIPYSIGSFDAKFGISEENFLSAAKEAEDIWEKPFGKDFFAFTPNGYLKIHLIYDYRQEATNKLGSLGLSVENTKSSYDNLKVNYDELDASYKRDKALYESRFQDFKTDRASYETEVDMWNKRGGAPKDVYDRLRASRESLDRELDALNQLRASLNISIENLNALATTLNRVAASLNLNVARYNEVGQSRGDEFEEGIYSRSLTEEKIDIYEYSTQSELIRVLAHELGHALGLPHVEDADSIMYRLNESSNEKLTADDLAALKIRCS